MARSRDHLDRSLNTAAKAAQLPYTPVASEQRFRGPLLQPPEDTVAGRADFRDQGSRRTGYGAEGTGRKGPAVISVDREVISLVVFRCLDPGRDAHYRAPPAALALSSAGRNVSNPGGRENPGNDYAGQRLRGKSGIG